VVISTLSHWGLVAEFGPGLFSLKLCVWTDQITNPEKHGNHNSNHNCSHQCHPPLIGCKSFHNDYWTPMLSRNTSVLGNKSNVAIVGAKSLLHSKCLVQANQRRKVA
jgi:hypothetical protein